MTTYGNITDLKNAVAAAIPDNNSNLVSETDVRVSITDTIDTLDSLHVNDLDWSAATKTVTNTNGTDAVLTDADGVNSGLMSVALYDQQATNTADIAALGSFGTAAAEDVGFFATAAQGALADTALQPATKLDDLAAPDDNTDLNVSISAHGLAPKLSNVATEFLNGTGTYSTPAGGGDLNASDIDTLAELNAIITDATLIDTGDSRLSDSRSPTNHASDHMAGGVDEVKLDDLAAPDDNTDLNVSTSAHGLVPKLSNVAAEFFNGVGSYVVPVANQVALTTEGLLLETAFVDGAIKTVTNFYSDLSGPSFSLDYKWVAASTATPDDCLCVKPTSIGGGSGRYIAQFSGAINAAWTGVKADATGTATGTPDSAAIQKAIDLALWGSTIWDIDWRADRVELPHGSYRIDTLIHINYGHSGFKSCSLVAKDHRDAGPGGAGVIFYSEASDRPCINFQGMRGGTVEGIYFIGVDSTVLTDSEPDEAVWDAIYPHVDDRPYAAITIDAFSGADPGGTPGTDQYAEWHTQSGPTALGIVDSWSKTHSSEVSIRNCRIRYFQCGIAIKPSGGAGADANADYIKCYDSIIQNCKWGMTANGSQTRENSFIDCAVDDCFASIAGGIYGPKTSGDLKLIRTDFSRNAWAVYSNIMNWTQSVLIDGCRAEAVGGIIYAHNGSSAACKVSIVNNHINMLATIDDENQSHYHLLAQNCDLTFNGNYIAMHHDALVSRPMFIGLVGATSKVECRGNTIQWSSAPTLPQHTAAEEVGFAWIANYAGTADVFDSGNTPAYLPWKKFASVSSQNMASGTLYVHNGAGEYYGRLHVNMRDDYFQAGDFIGVVSNNNNYRPYFFKVTLIEDSPSAQWATLQQINDCDGTTGEPLDAADVLATINTGSWLTFYRQQAVNAALTTTPSALDYVKGPVQRVTISDPLAAISDVDNLPSTETLDLYVTKTNSTDSLAIDPSNFNTPTNFLASTQTIPAGDTFVVRFTRMRAGTGGNEINAALIGPDVVTPSTYSDAANSGQMIIGEMIRLTTDAGSYTLNPTSSGSKETVVLFCPDGQTATFNSTYTITENLSAFVEEGGVFLPKGQGVKTISSGGASIKFLNDGSAVPSFSSAAGTGTLTTNGNTILSVTYTADSSGGEEMAFTHNVGSPPQYLAWTVSTGAQIAASSTITSANVFTLDTLGVSVSCTYRFDW